MNGVSGDEDETLERLLQRATAIEDREADERWEIVWNLHGRNDCETFNVVRCLATSPEPAERALALDVLAQIGCADDLPFLEDTLPVVIAACDDDDVGVLIAAISALGHLSDERGLPAVLPHAANECNTVRLAVAWALPSMAGRAPTDETVAALIRLSADPDSDVRDWATFGLGSQFDVDTYAVREALAARLTDNEGDTAGEALVGLARRRDARTLLNLLARLDDNPGALVVDAARELGAPDALAALLRLREEGWGDGDPERSVLDEAIEACSGRS